MNPPPTQALMPAPRQTTIWKRKIPKPLVGLMFVVLVLVIAFSLLGHRESANERLTGRVLESVQRNDMAPVGKDFNALTRERFTRASVGKNSDLLAPLGKIKSIRETTPKDAPARRHTFVAHFEHGDVNVIMVLDEDGKVSGFRFTPPSS
jgi:hypothetical protein